MDHSSLSFSSLILVFSVEVHEIIEVKSSFLSIKDQEEVLREVEPNWPRQPSTKNSFVDFATL
jgi:hypothetical protein